MLVEIIIQFPPHFKCREMYLLSMKINKITIIVMVTLTIVTSLGSEASGYGGPPEQSSAGEIHCRNWI